MKHLLILKTHALLSNPFVDRFIEGGPFFMSIILLCLILTCYFIIKGFFSILFNGFLATLSIFKDFKRCLGKFLFIKKMYTRSIYY